MLKPHNHPVESHGRTALRNYIIQASTLLEIILSYDTSRSGIAVLRSHNGVVQALTERGQTGSGVGFGRAQPKRHHGARRLQVGEVVHQALLLTSPARLHPSSIDGLPLL